MTISMGGQLVHVASLREARDKWNAYRNRTGVSASGMKRKDGNVYDAEGTLIARVSYNGRVWDPTNMIEVNVN